MKSYVRRISLCVGICAGALAMPALANAAVNAQINFQPATGATPAGYTADTGAAFTAASGRGWVREDSLSSATHIAVNLSANTRRRNVLVDTRLDTFIHMQFPSTSGAGGTTVRGAWEMVVPNGSYTVTAAVGDPSYFDSVHRINVEGQTLLANGATSAALPSRTATGTFTVTDGRITLDAIGGTNTKLDYVTIADAAAPVDTTAPGAPAGFTATGGNGQVALDWDDNSESDLAGYRVYRSTSPSVPVSGTPLSGASLLSSSAFTDSSAVNGTTYYYVVVAVDSSGNASVASAERSATPQAPVDTTAPGAPAGFTATGGNGQVALDWDDNSESDLAGYRVYRSTSPSVPVSGTPLSGASLLSSSAFTDSSAVNGTTYYYVVVAVDSSGNASVASAERSATPQAPVDTTAPGAPAGFTATGGNGQVALDWDDNSESDLAGYRVYRSTSPSVPVSGTPLSGASLLSSSAFTDSSAVNGTTYYYVVVAVDSSGNASVASAERSATPQAPPSGQTPYNGSAFSLPGTIEAEQYDNGGEGVAYHDFDAAQRGSGFRATSGVDVAATMDTGGGYNVGWIRAGEWLEYTVTVPTAGNYDIGLRWASGVSGGRGHVELNGTNVTGSMSLGGTGGWQTWSTISANGVSLPAGTSVLRVSFDSSNGATEIGNLNSIIVRNAGSGPPSGAPRWPASFTSGTAAPQPRFESADAAVGNKVYAFGGFSDSQFHVNRTYVSYDATTGSWTTLGTLPVGMAETHLGITHDDRYIYFAGGFAGDLHANQSPSQVVDNKVWRYDTTTNSFTQLTTLPQPRGAGALVLVGRQLHYIGGNPADRVTNLGDHFVYDLDTGVWTTEPSTPDPKDHASSAVIGSKIYILGGEKGHDQLHQQMNTSHVYDTVSGAWTKLANMPGTKSHTEGGTFVSNGKIVMAGGQVDNFQATNTVIAYDPATDSWSSLSPSLPALRQGAIVQPVGSRMVFALGAQFTDNPQAGLWTGILP